MGMELLFYKMKGYRDGRLRYTNVFNTSELCTCKGFIR